MRESEIEIEFVFDNVFSLRGILDRVLGPLIVEEIKSRLPIEGKAAHQSGETKITLGIGMGCIKPTRQVRRGDIAYVPLGDSLSIYIRDAQTFSAVNVIGRISSPQEQLDRLASLRRGASVLVRALTESQRR